MTRLQFHRARTIFWALQIPPTVVWGWHQGVLFCYLIVISQAALVESSATDWAAEVRDKRARNE